MRGQIAVSFIVGLFLACGLCLSGMTRPQNILAFLDVRHWSPVLLLVMVGAILVYGVAYRLIVLRPRPLLAAKFEIPTQRQITAKLVVGSAIFGVGWGLGGFCGGPAIVSLVAHRPEVIVFVVSMVAGMFAFQIGSQYLEARSLEGPQNKSALNTNPGPTV